MFHQSNKSRKKGERERGVNVVKSEKKERKKPGQANKNGRDAGSGLSLFTPSQLQYDSSPLTHNTLVLVK
jgi:hypothetical protein